MPSDKHFPAEEAPTKPSGGRIACPECLGADGKATGEIHVEEWRQGHIYRDLRQVCNWCFGDKFISFDALERWKAHRGIK